MSLPDQLQVDDEILRLTRMKPRIKQFSDFGDDPHEAIDAQITALSDRHALLSGQLNLLDVLKRYSGDWTSSCALDAFRWMAGVEIDPPSLSWGLLSQ